MNPTQPKYEEPTSKKQKPEKQQVQIYTKIPPSQPQQQPQHLTQQTGKPRRQAIEKIPD
jgi:hypothetical protein